MAARSSRGKPTPPPEKITVLPKLAYVSLTIVSFLSVLFFTWYLVVQRPPLTPTAFFLLLIIYGLCAAFMIFGISEVVAEATGHVLGFAIKAGGPFAALIIVVILGIWVNSMPDKQHQLNVRITGKAGSKDIELKSIPNALALIPTNQRGMLEEINQYGMAVFSSNETIEKDSVGFILNVPNYELVEPRKKYKIDASKDLEVKVRRQLTHYEFRFIDPADNKPVVGAKFSCYDFRIDGSSDSFGIVECDVDTVGKQTYLFSITPPPGYKNYIGEKELMIRNTQPKFDLEKIRK